MCTVSLLAMGGAAAAADAEVMPIKAPIVAPDVWWFHGYLEAGYRGFANDPCRNCSITSGQGSLAKYYEYSTNKPGPFGDGHIATGTSNGLYQADVWGRNIGYSDQSYLVDLSKAGEHYLTFGWDQTPHVYSTSALDLYNGAGTNALTLPAGLSAALAAAAGTPGNTKPPFTPPIGALLSPLTRPGSIPIANALAVQQLIDRNVHQSDIGIRRDTAAVEYRYTPTDNWDFRINYSNMRRTGTQVEGVVMSPGTSGVRVDAQRPVADTTQNYGANGEYAGTSAWGQKFNVKLAYAGSTYTDDINGYTVENPFCPAGSGANGCARASGAATTSPSSPLALMSTDPSNQANGFSGTVGMDLPLNNRYMGTVSYTMNRQNQTFLPFTLTAFPGGFPTGWIGSLAGGSVNSTANLPALSLNGGINNLLSNNVLMTQINSQLTAKTTYRYYSVDNTTPELLFPDWVVTDTKDAKATNASYAPTRSFAPAYTKQNAGEELVWRPTKTLNLGAAYGYERYDWSRADVNTTHENSVKLFGDWRPETWVNARGSLLASQRTYGTYDYRTLFGNYQWPSTGASEYLNTYRQYNLDNRDRLKGKFAVDIDLVRGLTISPTFGFQYDDYGTNPGLWQSGLNQDHAYNAGIEAFYRMNPNTGILFSYMYEDHRQLIYSSGTTDPATCDQAQMIARLLLRRCA